METTFCPATAHDRPETSGSSVNQLKRAALSVVLNIAEGADKYSSADQRCELSGAYAHQIYDNNRIRIVFERGVYSDSSGAFVSKESSASCSAAASPRPDAVRVTITVRNVPNLFASAVFTDQARSTLQRSAVGVQIGVAQ